MRVVPVLCAVTMLQCLLSPEEHTFFTDLTRDVTDACRLSQAPQEVQQRHPCRLPFDPVKPGGVQAYPAVWTQDFTMIYAAGFLSPETGLAHLRLILDTQNGPEPKTMNTGAVVPPWAIPDHVNFDGTPVYFPGTYSSGPDQGGDFGLRPPYNNYYDCIWLAWLLAAQLDNPIEFLLESIGGVSIYQRLQHAFLVPTIDPDGVVFTTAEARAVGFIFCDSIQMTGRLLMPTLQRRRAAGHLRDLAMLLQDSRAAATYAAEVDRALPAIPATFLHPSGWLCASTGQCAQPDVFGTLYALYTRALQGEDYRRCLHAVCSALDRGQIEQDGALRHVPLEHSASADSAWERTFTPGNTYQNGGYWFMPAGWLTAVLYRQRPEQARSYFSRYLASLKREDFRLGASGAPWEWIFHDQRSCACPVFGPSVTLPYAVLNAEAI